MTNINKIFINLIRISVGDNTNYIIKPTDEEWGDLYDLAKKQSLLGICFNGVQKLVKVQNGPPNYIYLKWLSITSLIIEKNEKVCLQCIELENIIKKKGFKACIIKGQSVAKYYGKLSNLRQSGDIDIWINSEPHNVLDWVYSINNNVEHYDYMHTKLNLFRTTIVEVHYRPMVSRNIIRNFKLQKLSRIYNYNTFIFDKDLSFTVPSIEFHTLIIFHHIYWHLLIEGVGFRQLMDLYFILLSIKDSSTKENIYKKIKEIGLEKFSNGLMWVLGYVFNQMNNVQRLEWMISNPDKQEGQYLLKEILLAGNMGHYDERLVHHNKKSKMYLVIKWINHSLRLIKHYPWDVIWTPFGIAFISMWKYYYKTKVVLIKNKDNFFMYFNKV